MNQAAQNAIGSLGLGNRGLSPPSREAVMADVQRLTDSPSFNLARHATSHVTQAAEIANSLPEDADEAAAILADAARFHAVIRDRKASAVFANVLSKVAE